MDSAWLLDFVALAKTGNFSRAAEMRHVSQPAFSRRVRLLEEWVGARLLDRGSHPVAMTVAGRQFLPFAETVLEKLDEARRAALAAEAERSATLCFAVTQVLSLGFFPNWLRSIATSTPIGPINLISDSLEACENSMLQGGSQFLLGHYLEGMPWRLRDAEFTSVIVCADRLIPVSAADASGAPIYSLDSGEDGELPFLGYEANGLGRVFATGLDEKAVRPRLVPVARSHLALLLGLALEGRGVAWVPESVVRAELDRGSIVLASADRWAIPTEIRLYRPRVRQNAAAEEFWRVVAAATSPSPIAGVWA